MKVYNQITLSIVLDGEKGDTGVGAINVIVANDTQNIPCTTDGVVNSNFLIEIPFSAYQGFDKVDCSVTVGILPSGITLGSVDNATSANDGKILLNVAKGSNLGGNNINTGNITLTFSIADQKIVKIFTWTKTKDGATGSPARFYSLAPSSLIIKKATDDTFIPESITFHSYYQDGNNAEKFDYNGRFIIQESVNGSSFTSKYISSDDESEKVYTPSSSNIVLIKCILYAAGGITNELDSQTVTVLLDNENLLPEITEIKTSIESLGIKVDKNTQSISEKASKTDITTAINNYDGTTIKTLRDQVAEQTISIQGINSTVSDVKTTLEQKADGSDVLKLEERISTSEQTVEGFKQTVEKTYATKDELDEAITQSKSLVLVLSNEFQTVSTDTDGNNGDYSKCKTTASMMLGVQNITNSSTFAATPSDGIIGSWDNESKTYIVNNMTVDNGYVDITGTYDNQRLTKRFSISKIKATDAKVYNLEPSSIVMEKTSENRFDPQTITFKSYVQNSSGSVSSFNGYFKIYEKNLSGEYIEKYSSSAPQSSKEYIPSSISIYGILCELYTANDFKNKVDTQTIAIISNDNINIGVRNYIRNSKTMIFDSYGFV